MWNVEFNTLNDFQSISIHDLDWARFCQVAANPQIHKTSMNWPSDGLYTEVGLHLMRNAGFNTMNDFLCIGAYNRGNLGQSLQLTPIPQIY